VLIYISDDLTERNTTPLQDEATSALDNESEAMVQEALDVLVSQSTYSTPVLCRPAVTS
jgi:ABC-type transport system involved in cytochrome bd biosynthesis fused ATPase/permease subunit